jgi:hypothetical protein
MRQATEGANTTDGRLIERVMRAIFLMLCQE